MNFKIETPDGDIGYLIPDGGEEGQVLHTTNNGIQWKYVADEVLYYSGTMPVNPDGEPELTLGIYGEAVPKVGSLIID